MYHVLNPDFAHVLLENLELIIERDQTLRGTWSILAIRNDAPDTFLTIRQARHGGFTVWSTAEGGRLLGYSNHPSDACTEILRHL